ncbi:MAG: C39 family peptidase [Candidatus Dormibacteria bacterium]
MLSAFALMAFQPLAHGRSARASHVPRATLLSYQDVGDAYTSLDPIRILDTRVTNSTLGSGASLSIPVVGDFSGEVVPAGATAVVVNVTVTDTTSGGFLTLYPTGDALPLVSNLNWASGETRANLGIIPIGEDGEITIYNDVGRTDVVVDLQGYFAPQVSDAGSYTPLPPSRIVDTRPGSGEPYANSTLGGGQSLNVQVTGEGGIPTSGVEGVVVNVTVTNTTQGGYLQAYPEGTEQPLTSNVNWGAGETVANRVIVPVGASGQLTLYNDVGSADVVVDVDGYFDSASATPTNPSFFYPVSPTRILDTRLTGARLGYGVTMTEPMTGGQVPDTADAVVTNLTVTNTTAGSYLEMYPESKTLDSDLNWGNGQTVANLGIVSLSPYGTSTAYNAEGEADLVLDVSGYFQAQSPTAATSYTCTGGALASNISSGVIGDPVGDTVSGVSCPVGSASYEYFYQQAGAPSWTLEQSWTSSVSVIYDTYGWPAGNYDFMAEASNAPQVASQLQVQTSLSIASGGGFLVSNVTYHYQIYDEDCEEASLQMALSHEGINVAQGGGAAPYYDAAGTILGVEGVEYPPFGVGGPTGDPYKHFVGEPNPPLGAPNHGLEPGAYYPVISRAAQALGGDVLAAGQGISPQQIYLDAEENHPSVAWVTFDFTHQNAHTVCAEGDCFPYAGPDGHAVVVIGVGADSVLIDNPWGPPWARFNGRYEGQDVWVPMSVFEAAYSSYGDMAVVLS